MVELVCFFFSFYKPKQLSSSIVSLSADSMEDPLQIPTQLCIPEILEASKLCSRTKDILWLTTQTALPLFFPKQFGGR